MEKRYRNDALIFTVKLLKLNKNIREKKEAEK
jgi:hypothetical protein